MGPQGVVGRASKAVLRRLLATLLLLRGEERSAGLGRGSAPLRLLVVANADIPTLQLSLVAPLQRLLDSGECFIALLTEQDLKSRFPKQVGSAQALAWATNRFDSVNPTHVVFCRYSGPHAEALLEHARARGIPSLYVIDDDLLNVPREIGLQKYEYHNQPRRLAAVRFLLDRVDVAYCSNARLRERLKEIGVLRPLAAGEIFCAGEVLEVPVLRGVRTIGYMGFDHALDFEIALPALINVLRRYPEIHFELFGKIPKPTALNEFGERITVLPVVRDYRSFMAALAGRKWDIGICPLLDTPFNRVKNINKWIEYSSVGAAVIATRGSIYDECCSEGRGLLASSDEWERCLRSLIDEPQERFRMVERAQEHLVSCYGLEQQRDSLLALLYGMCVRP